MTIKSRLEINNANPLCLIINTINFYIKENNENRYLALVPTDTGKDTLIKYKELSDKIRDLSSVTQTTVMKII